MIDLSALPIEKWMELNAKLQQKKRALRADLKERGVLVKDKANKYDKYKYFSEAGYKKLFTELFSKHGLEITSSAHEVVAFEGSNAQPFGRRAHMSFTLSDCDTGFYEVSEITGDGVDKGDKGLYKAYTGALKYYLADTFMVATGDEPENDDGGEDEQPQDLRNKPQQQQQQPPQQQQPQQPHVTGFANEAQCALLRQYYGDRVAGMLATHKVSRLEELPAEAANKYILIAIEARKKKALENGAGN